MPQSGADQYQCRVAIRKTAASPRSTTNLAHDPDISGQLLCRPEILNIADRRQQDCRAFRTDSLEGLQIVEAIHFTVVGIDCLVQLFNAFVQAADLRPLVPG